MWRFLLLLFFSSLFLTSPSFCASGGLCFVNAAITGHSHLLFTRFWLSFWRCEIVMSVALCTTKTRNFDPLKPQFYIVKLGFTGVYIIDLFLLKNIDCGFSLEEIWKISEFLSENFRFLGVKFSIYSLLSLSRTRLSLITAYLEVKVWSLPKHENLTTGKKNIVEKRRNCSSASRVQLHIHLLNVVVRIIYSSIL